MKNITTYSVTPNSVLFARKLAPITRGHTGIITIIMSICIAVLYALSFVSCKSTSNNQATRGVSFSAEPVIFATKNISIDGVGYWHTFELEDEVLISNNEELFALPPDIRTISSEDIFLQLFVSQNENIGIVYDLLQEEEPDTKAIKDIIYEFFGIAIPDTFNQYEQESVVVLEYEVNTESTNNNGGDLKEAKSAVWKILLIKPLFTKATKDIDVGNSTDDPSRIQRAIVLGETQLTSSIEAKKLRILALVQSLKSI